MKPIVVILSIALCACTVTTTTNTLPDGTKVVVVAKSSDPVAIQGGIDSGGRSLHLLWSGLLPSRRLKR
jgi:hypothetical protein